MKPGPRGESISNTGFLGITPTGGWLLLDETAQVLAFRDSSWS